MLPTDRTDTNSSFALFNLGFRPFFLLGALFAAVSTPVWTAAYLGGFDPGLALPAMSWHAHEMIYGYAMAIIAGFLLTAVRNWTGQPTAAGKALAGLVALWAAARLAPLLPESVALAWMAGFDLAFGVLLLAAVAAPIVRARAWRQAGVLSKIMLLTLGNALFYSQWLGWTEGGARAGLYLGLYLVVALILTMGRRVIPFFTERGVDYPVTLRNWRWLDVSSLLGFVLFVVLDLAGARPAAAALALALFPLYGIRLFGWHTPGIWRKPLLWSLWAGYAFIVAGFPLYTASVYFGISPFISVHAFAFGGIGLVTLGMAARVSLGHTGRNIHAPPRAVGVLLAVLAAGALVRVGLPLVDPGHYAWWVATSQIMWIMAFAGFVLIYFPILTRPRIDGQPG